MSECYDAVILGSGIAGLCCAEALAQNKMKVLLISRQDIKGEATQASAGIMDPFLELRAGHPLLSWTRRAFHGYPDFIRELEKETGENTEFQETGMIYTACDSKEETKLRNWFAWQRKTDIPAEWLRGPAIEKRFPSFSSSIRAGLFYPTIRKVNPVNLKMALWKRLKAYGVKRRSISKFAQLSIQKNRVQGVRWPGQSISSPIVIIAAGSWSGTAAWGIHSVPVVPVRGQVVLVGLPGTGRETIVHTAREGCYAVPWGKNRYLLGATVEKAGFRAQVTQKGIRFIFDALTRVWPDLNRAKIIETRAGLRPRSKDDMPIVGKGLVEGLFYATGYYRSGILLGPSTGRLLAESILKGRLAPILEPFSPLRFFN